jgi:CheY-like chemotaxis protein
MKEWDSQGRSRSWSCEASPDFLDADRLRGTTRGRSARRSPEERMADAYEERLIGHRVLVVDDNQMVANCIGDSLKLLGAQVKVAYSGPSALRLCEHWFPTSALVDLRMHGMDGCEVAREMRARFYRSPCRLIALSGIARDENGCCADTAFDLRLVKPVPLEDLVAALLRERQAR